MEAFNVKETEFPTAIQKGVVVADFFATWCMPCVMMGQIIENLADKHKDVNFIKVNIEESKNITQDLEISSLPCVVFFVDGKEIDRINGNVSQDFIEQKIQSFKK
jgi:thioredoxin 1